MLLVMVCKFTTILAVGLVPILLPSCPEKGAAAAYYDATRLPKHEACFFRYVWWDESWKDYQLLTRVTQATISLERDFPRPVKVAPWVMRLDMRESGHQKFLVVWENFRKLDFVFHNKQKVFKDSTYLTYYPSGFYPTWIGEKKEKVEQKWYEASVQEVAFKAGQVIDVPSIVANVEVDIPDKKGEKGKALDELRKILHTEVPILWGPFWMVRVQRQIDIRNFNNGVGYYEWFGYEDRKSGKFVRGIKNRDDYFKVLAVDEKEYVGQLFELRAYIKKSGVSNQSRQIVVLAERVWGTLDVFNQADPVDDDNQSGQPALNLLRGEFRHNAERWIGLRADGFWLNGLFAATGETQDTAPDKIGGDTSAMNQSLDKKIGPDNCIHCHGILKRSYIIPFDDWLRKNVVRARMVMRAKSRDQELELTAYLRSISLIMRHNQEKFADAVARLTRDENDPKDPGMTVDAFAKWWRGAYYQYIAHDEGVTREMAAKYVGVKAEAFAASIEAVKEARGFVDPVTANYLGKTPEGVHLSDFESLYPYWAITARGVQAPDLLIRVKGFDSSVKKK
jgi:hypothetical protein